MLSPLVTAIERWVVQKARCMKIIELVEATAMRAPRDDNGRNYRQTYEHEDQHGVYSIPPTPFKSIRPFNKRPPEGTFSVAELDWVRTKALPDFDAHFLSPVPSKLPPLSTHFLKSSLFPEALLLPAAAFPA